MHPRATYRLQLSAAQTFGHAADLVGYLADLGISHLYLSPILTARPGTRHHYDVADHSRIDASLGGEEGLRALAAVAHDAGLGLIADIVPHHMGVGPWSPLWDTLLREGRSSDAAKFFDVDWETPLPGAQDKVILPVLSGPYGEELAAGRLRLAETPAGVRVTYGEVSFPLSAETVDAVERAGADRLAGRPGEPRSWGRMHSLLEQQHYRLVSWRAGRRLTNYRRYRHLDDLAALRVEDDTVFDATHRVMVGLVADGTLDGLRVDHLDGLADPTGYLHRLRDAVGPDAWLIVETITSAARPLQPAWPVDGTSGLALLRTAVGMHVDPHGWRALRILAEAHGGVPDARDRWRMKAQQLDSQMGPDLRRLVRVAWDACQDEIGVRDVDYRTLLEAFTRLLVALPVQRTYIDPTTGEASEADTDAIGAAVAAAAADASRRRVPEVVWRHLQALLSGEVRWSTAAAETLTRFQQLSGPVAALGVEERLFLRHHVLVAACELGCDPDDVPLTVPQIHEELRQMPATGLRATATHDTVHAEDVRMRMIALAGMSAEWSTVADRILAGSSPPDAGLGLRMLQVVVGVWPITDDGRTDLTTVLDTRELVERVVAYATTVARGQDLATSHANPDPDFEGELAIWVRSLLDPGGGIAPQLRPLARRAAEVGMAAGLSQTLLRIVTRGVPDTYQGTERWDDSLLDPDNRRPVDFDRLQAAAAGWGDQPPDIAGLWADRRDGRIKQWVLRQALHARRSHPGVFGPDGAQDPVAAEGRWAAHLVTLHRRDAAHQAVAVCPRVLGRVTDGGRFPPVGRIWADTDLALPAVAEGASWHDALSGRTIQAAPSVPVSTVLADLPVALLIAPRPPPAI